jgi:hypothetical protein
MDTVLSSYNDGKMVWGLPVDMFLKLYGKLRERQKRERYWDLYTNAYPHFTKDTFKTFDDFMGKNKQKLKDETTKKKKVETAGGIINRVSRYLSKARGGD